MNCKRMHRIDIVCSLTFVFFWQEECYDGDDMDDNDDKDYIPKGNSDTTGNIKLKQADYRWHRDSIEKTYKSYLLYSREQAIERETERPAFCVTGLLIFFAHAIPGCLWQVCWHLSQPCARAGQVRSSSRERRKTDGQSNARRASSTWERLTA